MRRSTVQILAGGVILAVIAVLTAMLPLSHADEKEKKKELSKEDRKKIARILQSEMIWERGFPNVVVRLSAWSAANEKVVAVFPKKVVGSLPHKGVGATEKLILVLKTASNRKIPALREEFRFFAKQIKDKADFKTVAMDHFADDDSVRIAWESEAPLIRRHVPMTKIVEEIGEPDRVRKVVVRSPDRERRPVILTVHSYAGGAVEFAQSDWSAKPSTVDRVFLNVEQLSQVLFEQRKKK